MDQHLQKVYLLVVAWECEACGIAIGTLRTCLGEANRNSSHVFFAAAALVRGAAGVSRILWPPRNRDRKAERYARARAAALRALLGIADTHPVRSRVLRDHFDHFDERLDHWAKNSKGKNLATRNIGPLRKLGNFDPADVFHHFDTDTGHYIFRGESFDLQELMDGLADIRDRVNAKLAELGGQ